MQSTRARIRGPFAYGLTLAGAGGLLQRTMTISSPSPIRGRAAGRSRLVRAAAAVVAWGAGSAHASFLSGDTLDAAADVLAWIVLVIVPVIGIAVFWIVHVLPEKIAHRRHHPQTQAIQTLCLLSLVFGGLLWPFAWLWAYTRPAGYKLAYGTDKGDSYFAEEGEKARAGKLSADELEGLRHEIAALEAHGALPPPIARLRDDLAAAPAAAPSGAGSG